MRLQLLLALALWVPVVTLAAESTSSSLISSPSQASAAQPPAPAAQPEGVAETNPESDSSPDGESEPLAAEPPDQLPPEGTWQYPNGDSYYGGWEAGQPHGQGTYRKANGELYRGHFEHGVITGKGRYLFKNGDVYKGEWADGQMNGQGRMIYRTGNVYRGEWRDGVRQGQGRLEYASGTVYEGSWIRDQKSGYGLTIYSNGARYVGDYRFDRPHGHGVSTSPNGEVYRGTFSKGVPHGVGECDDGGREPNICLFDRGKRLENEDMLRRAANYYERYQDDSALEAGISYQMQNLLTNERSRVRTSQVWWERKSALLDTRLQIHSRDNHQFLLLSIEDYNGPGIYLLNARDVAASTLDGDHLLLASDARARVEISVDDGKQIKGKFSISELKPVGRGVRYQILDGEFVAGDEPPLSNERGFFPLY